MDPDTDNAEESPAMKRVLVTGMSGVGESSVLDELRRRG
jgi:hypothetical protein